MVYLLRRRFPYIFIMIIRSLIQNLFIHKLIRYHYEKILLPYFCVRTWHYASHGTELFISGTFFQSQWFRRRYNIPWPCSTGLSGRLDFWPGLCRKILYYCEKRRFHYLPVIPDRIYGAQFYFEIHPWVDPNNPQEEEYAIQELSINQGKLNRTDYEDSRRQRRIITCTT